jgi:hypothetical protein
MPHTVETVETVPESQDPLDTELKLGVNEMRLHRIRIVRTKRRGPG